MTSLAFVPTLARLRFVSPEAPENPRRNDTIAAANFLGVEIVES
jgi:hypothetical protein